ncbi:neuraminidase, partial [Influenza A virus (A/swine/Fujian/43/2007(H3N2))]
SCYPRYPEVRCFCRDNWRVSNRPFLYVNMKNNTFNSSYVCSGLVGDTPRNDDGSSSRKGRDPNNERGAPGVKGGALDNENDFWMEKTIKEDSRSGYEIFGVIGGGATAISKSQINRQVIADSDNWSGYSGIFSVEGKNCINGCFYV